MTKFLITGGAGFIGSNIAESLLHEGHQVRVLDNLSTGFQRNLDAIPDAEFIEGDIRDENVVARALKGVEVVYHQAALASVPRSMKDPLATHDHCVTGTISLLHNAVKTGVRRVVYAASSSAYGDQPFSSKRETDMVSPLSPYAAAKLAAELYCRSFYAAYGLETVCLRYFNVFGPRQDPDGEYSAVIPRFVTRLLKKERPTIYGDGLQSRDFTYIENVVQANLLAATAPEAPGQVLNVANGKTTSLLAILDSLKELLGCDIAPIHEPARKGDVRDSLADITRTRKVLGYEPKVSVAEGLERSIEFYRTTLT